MTSRVCTICAKPITVHERVRGGLCSAPACRMAADRRHLAEERAEAERQRQALAARHADALLDEHPSLRARVALVVLVGTDAPLVEVRPERRERLRTHLRNTLGALREDASLHEDAAPPPHATTPAHAQALESPPPSALAQACALCRGYCCVEGGDEAFIDTATLARARALYPALSDDALCALYMDALPALGIAGSCVFHGQGGCSLPRSLRARICNEYYCEPIRQWAEPAAEPLRPAAVVAVRDMRVRRAALIDG